MTDPPTSEERRCSRCKFGGYEMCDRRIKQRASDCPDYTPPDPPTSQPESERVEEDRLILSGYILIRLTDKSWRLLYEEDGDWFPCDGPLTAALDYCAALLKQVERHEIADDIVRRLMVYADNHGEWDMGDVNLFWTDLANDATNYCYNHPVETSTEKLRARVESLERVRDIYKELAEAHEQMNVAYRIGKQSMGAKAADRTTAAKDKLAREHPEGE